MAQGRGLGRRLETVAVLGVSAALRAAPVRMRIAFGHALGDLACRLDRRHRELSACNQADALGLPREAALALTRRTFRFFGRAFAEVLAMPAYLGPGLERFVSVEGLENLDAAYRLGRGVIVCSAHIGNWELAGLRQARAGYPTDYISRPLDNPWLYDRLIAWREAGGIRTHTKHGAVRSAMKTLRDGRCLAFVIDQNMTIPPRVFVPFFGRLAATPMTMGHLALRHDVPVVPAHTVPKDDGTYLLRYAPALVPPPSGDLEDRVRALTLEATRHVERWVRATPHSWLWLHDRWKTRPGPEDVLPEGFVLGEGGAR